MSSYITDFAVIVVAVAVVDGFFFWLDKHLKKVKEEFLCDLCNKPRALKSTKDKKLWLCRNCIKVYK